MTLSNTFRFAQSVFSVLTRTNENYIQVENKLRFHDRNRGRHATTKVEVSDEFFVLGDVSDLSSTEGVTGFGQSLSGSIRSASGQNTTNTGAGFAQSILFRITRSSHTLEDSVSFTQGVSGSIKSATKRIIANSIKISDLIGGSPRVTHQGGFTQRLSYVLECGRSISKTISFIQDVSYYILRNKTEVTAPKKEAPKLTLTVGEQSISIRAPRIGNTKNIIFDGIERRTKENLVRLYKPTSFAASTEHHYEVEQEDVATFVAFERSNRGKVIVLNDHHDTLWEGLIKIEPIRYTQGLQSISFTFYCWRKQE